MGIDPGTRVGTYEVVGAIGAGGMGEVYRARDAKLGRDVALKVLPEDFSSDPERMARFEREAKVLASLNHTNIAAIYGFEDSAGVHALAMELVEGPTLADLIAMGPLRIEDALPIARQIADGLEYAHERGIVHRDLKPANVKITPDQVVKLLDFGLAKALEGEAAAGDISSSPMISRMVTQAGVILGTAAYMSPEQAKGRPVDRRADVWAFGCVVYEMLTGKKPFSGETVTDVLAALVKDEPDWSALPKATPRRVHELLRRCLTKDLRQRLQSIGEARIAVEQTLAGSAETLAEGPALRSRREIVAWGLVAALAIAATGAAALAWLARAHSSTANVPAALAYIPPPPGTSFRFFGFSPGPMVVSADGKEMAFSATDQKGVTKIWVRPLNGGEAKVLAGTEGGSMPFWSADGRSLGFFADEKLKTVVIGSGTVQTLGDTTCTSVGGAWSSQNAILFVPQCGGPIDSVPASGGAPQPVMQPMNGEISVGSAAFLPSGSKFLYVAQDADGRPAIRMASLSGGKSRLILSGAGSPEFASGDLLFLRGGKIFAQRFDPVGGKLTGDAMPLAEAYRYSASENGVLAFQGGSADARLEWFDRNGNPVGAIGGVQPWVSPKISPDGKQLLVVEGEHGSMQANVLGAQVLWSYPVGGGVGTRLTFGPSHGFSVWSHNGKYIAYSCQPGGNLSICLKAADGSGAPTTLQKLGTNITRAWVVDWSPDGRNLSLNLEYKKDQRWGTWILPLYGDRKLYQPAPENADQYDGNFSPDGHWLAYFSYETGRPEVFVVPFPPTGGKYQISQNGGWLVRWAAGDKLFFLTMNNRLMEANLKVTGNSLQVQSITPLFQVRLPMTNAPLYDVTPDGQRFIVATAADPEAASSISLLLNWPSLVKGR